MAPMTAIIPNTILCRMVIGDAVDYRDGGKSSSVRM